MNIPGSGDGANNLLDILQQFKTFAGGVLAIGLYRGLRMFFRSIKRDPETKAEQFEKEETRRWLSQQDRRVRETVERTDADNVKLRNRIEEIEANIIEKDHEVERERQSGMRHYQKSFDIYQYAQKLVHEWRNSKLPPDEMKKFEDF